MKIERMKKKETRWWMLYEFLCECKWWFKPKVLHDYQRRSSISNRIHHSHMSFHHRIAQDTHPRSHLRTQSFSKCKFHFRSNHIPLQFSNCWNSHHYWCCCHRHMFLLDLSGHFRIFTLLWYLYSMLTISLQLKKHLLLIQVSSLC